MATKEYEMSSIYDISATTITGETTTLQEFAGKTLLIVNVASKCGLTPQYEQLEALFEQSADKGLVVLGFPSNEFLGQEPGTEAEIMEFCQTTFGVKFPMFSKISVNAEPRHPLYAHLIAAQAEAQTAPDSGLKAKLDGGGLLEGRAAGDIMWNFEKFLVSADGEVVGRFAPDMGVDHPVLAAAIEQQLAS